MNLYHSSDIAVQQPSAQVLWIHLPALQRKNHNRNQNRRLLVPGVKG
jgi:hypothetical protein